jgi:hypothetical protein
MLPSRRPLDDQIEARTTIMAAPGQRRYYDLLDARRCVKEERVTAFQLLRVLARRWYVLVVVAAITGAAVLLVQCAPGVYWTQVNIVFLPPKNANVLEDQNTSIVQFVAVIEREFNETPDTTRSASSSGTLYGEGVRSGWQVSLSNNGGQWQNNFNRPSLSIEVVDSSPRKVVETAASLSAKVSRLAETQQNDIGIATKNHVTTINSPASPVVSYVQGSNTRAGIAVIALGTVTGVLAAALVDWIVLAAPGRASRTTSVLDIDGDARARRKRKPPMEKIPR